MPTPSFHSLRGLVRTIDYEIEDRMAVETGPAEARLVCARAHLRIAVDELTAAIAAIAPAPSGERLVIEVISPGADRADQTVADIPADVLSLSDRAATLRLDLPYNAESARLVDAIMRRNGWRPNGVGWWDRPGFGAAAGVARPAGQPL